MTRDEMLVLTELNRMCTEAPAFALGFPDGNLPVADEYAFGFRLLDIANGVLRHARERDGSSVGDYGNATIERQGNSAYRRSCDLVLELDGP
jgi:hypothetical protein